MASESLEHVDIKLDYMGMNNAATFEELGDSRTKSEEAGGQIILSGEFMGWWNKNDRQYSHQ